MRKIIVGVCDAITPSEFSVARHPNLFNSRYTAAICQRFAVFYLLKNF